MRQPGIEVRPIGQVDGSAEFNEVFFSGARCPADNAVGGVNNGWKVAMTTLGFERGSSATTGHRRFARELDHIVSEARKRGRDTDPLIRQRLARAWSNVKIMEINGYRSLTDALHGTTRQRRSAPATRCSGRSRTRRSWTWPWTSSGPTARCCWEAAERTTISLPAPDGDARTIRSATSRHRSSSPDRIASAGAQRRSSAISSANGCSGCRRSRARSRRADG